MKNSGKSSGKESTSNLESLSPRSEIEDNFEAVAAAVNDIVTIEGLPGIVASGVDGQDVEPVVAEEVKLEYSSLKNVIEKLSWSSFRVATASSYGNLGGSKQQSLNYLLGVFNDISAANRDGESQANAGIGDSLTESEQYLGKLLKSPDATDSTYKQFYSYQTICFARVILALAEEDQSQTEAQFQLYETIFSGKNKDNKFTELTTLKMMEMLRANLEKIEGLYDSSKVDPESNAADLAIFMADSIPELLNRIKEDEHSLKRSVFNYSGASRERQIFNEIISGKLETVLSSKDLFIRDSNGDTPLMVATRLKHTDIVKQILQLDLVKDSNERKIALLATKNFDGKNIFEISTASERHAISKTLKSTKDKSLKALKNSNPDTFNDVSEDSELDIAYERFSLAGITTYSLEGCEHADKNKEIEELKNEIISYVNSEKLIFEDDKLTEIKNTIDKVCFKGLTNEVLNSVLEVNEYETSLLHLVVKSCLDGNYNVGDGQLIQEILSFVMVAGADINEIIDEKSVVGLILASDKPDDTKLGLLRTLNSTSSLTFNSNNLVSEIKEYDISNDIRKYFSNVGIELGKNPKLDMDKITKDIYFSMKWKMLASDRGSLLKGTTRSLFGNVPKPEQYYNKIQEALISKVPILRGTERFMLADIEKSRDKGSDWQYFADFYSTLTEVYISLKQNNPYDPALKMIEDLRSSGKYYYDSNIFEVVKILCANSEIDGDNLVLKKLREKSLAAGHTTGYFSAHDSDPAADRVISTFKFYKSNIAKGNVEKINHEMEIDKLFGKNANDAKDKRKTLVDNSKSLNLSSYKQETRDASIKVGKDATTTPQASAKAEANAEYYADFINHIKDSIEYFNLNQQNKYPEYKTTLQRLLKEIDENKDLTDLQKKQLLSSEKFDVVKGQSNILILLYYSNLDYADINEMCNRYNINPEDQRVKDNYGFNYSMYVIQHKIYQYANTTNQGKKQRFLNELRNLLIEYPEVLQDDTFLYDLIDVNRAEQSIADLFDNDIALNLLKTRVNPSENLRSLLDILNSHSDENDQKLDFITSTSMKEASDRELESILKEVNEAFGTNIVAGANMRADIKEIMPPPPRPIPEIYNDSKKEKDESSKTSNKEVSNDPNFRPPPPSTPPPLFKGKEEGHKDTDDLGEQTHPNAELHDYTTDVEITKSELYQRPATPPPPPSKLDQQKVSATEEEGHTAIEDSKENENVQKDDTWKNIVAAAEAENMTISLKPGISLSQEKLASLAKLLKMLPIHAVVNKIQLENLVEVIYDNAKAHSSKETAEGEAVSSKAPPRAEDNTAAEGSIKKENVKQDDPRAKILAAAAKQNITITLKEDIPKEKLESLAKLLEMTKNIDVVMNKIKREGLGDDIYDNTNAKTSNKTAEGKAVSSRPAPPPPPPAPASSKAEKQTVDKDSLMADIEKLMEEKDTLAVKDFKQRLNAIEDAKKQVKFEMMEEMSVATKLKQAKNHLKSLESSDIEPTLAAKVDETSVSGSSKSAKPTVNKDSLIADIENLMAEKDNITVEDFKRRLNDIEGAKKLVKFEMMEEMSVATKLKQAQAYLKSLEKPDASSSTSSTKVADNAELSVKAKAEQLITQITDITNKHKNKELEDQEFISQYETLVKTRKELNNKAKVEDAGIMSQLRSPFLAANEIYKKASSKVDAKVEGKESPQKDLADKCKALLDLKGNVFLAEYKELIDEINSFKDEDNVLLKSLIDGVRKKHATESMAGVRAAVHGDDPGSGSDSESESEYYSDDDVEPSIARARASYNENISKLKDYNSELSRDFIKDISNDIGDFQNGSLVRADNDKGSELQRLLDNHISINNALDKGKMDDSDYNKIIRLANDLEELPDRLQAARANCINYRWKQITDLIDSKTPTSPLAQNSMHSNNKEWAEKQDRSKKLERIKDYLDTIPEDDMEKVTENVKEKITNFHDDLKSSFPQPNEPRKGK